MKTALYLRLGCYCASTSLGGSCDHSLSIEEASEIKDSYKYLRSSGFVNVDGFLFTTDIGLEESQRILKNMVGLFPNVFYNNLVKVKLYTIEECKLPEFMDPVDKEIQKLSSVE